ncbi:unnamed protein product, partial [Nesidiocoris tenuis]
MLWEGQSYRRAVREGDSCMIKPLRQNSSRILLHLHFLYFMGPLEATSGCPCLSFYWKVPEALQVLSSISILEGERGGRGVTGTVKLKRCATCVGPTDTTPSQHPNT